MLVNVCGEWGNGVPALKAALSVWLRLFFNFYFSHLTTAQQRFGNYCIALDSPVTTLPHFQASILYASEYV